MVGVGGFQIFKHGKYYWSWWDLAQIVFREWKRADGQYPVAFSGDPEFVDFWLVWHNPENGERTITLIKKLRTRYGLAYESVSEVRTPPEICPRSILKAVEGYVSPSPWADEYRSRARAYFGVKDERMEPKARVGFIYSFTSGPIELQRDTWEVLEVHSNGRVLLQAVGTRKKIRADDSMVQKWRKDKW